ncbi:MAG: hypothetical protein Q8Q90_02380 [bacterium]|nr:hypothetical protein [bacterium]
MPRITSVTVECKCGEKIFKYHKSGTGRLIKCFVSKISADYFSLPKKLPTGSAVACPKCGERVGVVQMIKGQVAVKLNQGQIKPIRIG